MKKIIDAREEYLVEKKVLADNLTSEMAILIKSPNGDTKIHIWGLQETLDILALMLEQRIQIEKPKNNTQNLI